VGQKFEEALDMIENALAFIGDLQSQSFLHGHE
jgi:hypothetical protein